MALTRTTAPPAATASPSPSSPLSASIAGSDFVRLVSPKRQAVITLVGDTGVGKDHFALFNAPQPIYLFNLDGRAEDITKEALNEGRDVHYVEVPNPSAVINLSEDECRKVSKEGVNKILRNMEVAKRQSLANLSQPGTIVIDTGTELSDLVTLAIRGKFDKVKDYGESKSTITRTMMRFFALAREGRCHLVVLARPAAIWKDSEPTNKRKARGHDFLSEGVDWVGELKMKPRRPTNDNPKPFEHEIEILKAGVNLEMIGKVFKSADPEWGVAGPFAYLNMSMYRGSSMEDWW